MAECWTLVSTPAFAVAEIQSVEMQDPETGSESVGSLFEAVLMMMHSNVIPGVLCWGCAVMVMRGNHGDMG